MAIIFEIGSRIHFGLAFGERFGIPVSNNRVYLPNYLGIGFIQEVFLDEELSFCFHQYQLEQDFILKQLGSNAASDFLTLKVGSTRVTMDGEGRDLLLFAPGCEAELGTGNFFSEVFFPADQEISFLVINISRRLLVNILKPEVDGSQLFTGLLKSSSFLVNAPMSPEMERLVKGFGTIQPDTPLSHLSYLIKIYEITFQLFSSMSERSIDPGVNISRPDANKLYEVRSAIILDLSKTPNLTALAKKAAMSPTKMKMLFRHLFGSTIYNYFQAARMNEAAKLLKDLSVTEAGYRLGFTNMSHFSRVFEKYFKLKPKKYKNQL